MHLIGACLPTLPLSGVETLSIIHPRGGGMWAHGGGVTMGWWSGIMVRHLGVGVSIHFLSGHPRLVAK
jgi:hypothetical protein